MSHLGKIVLFIFSLKVLGSNAFCEPYKCDSEQYYSGAYLDQIKSERLTPVIMVTGWSENSLHSTTLKQAQKQTRAFAASYLHAVRLYQIYGKVKLFYLTTCPISEDYRRYLYRVGTGDFGIDGFRDFEKYALKLIVFNRPRHRKNTPPGDLDGFKKGTQEFPQAQNFFFSKRNRTLLNTLKGHMEAYRKSSRFEIVGLDAHSNSPLLAFIARYLNIPLLGNKHQHPDVGSKSHGRLVYKQARIPHPRGSYYPTNDPKYLAEEIYELLLEGINKAILKIDRSSAGEGLEILDFTTELTQGFMDLDDARQSINLILLKVADLPSKYLDKLHEHGAIVEEFIDAKNSYSPAAMLMIDKSKVELLGLYLQELGGDSGLHYQGSRGPISPPLLAKGALAIGNLLAKTGIKGPVGIDFLSCIIDDCGKSKSLSFAIENNIRHPSTMYPYMCMKHLLGEEFLQSKYFKINENLRIPIMTNSKIRNKHQTEFYKWLSHQDFTFSRETRKGVLIHGEYSAIGKLSAVAIADTPNEAAELINKADHEIRQRIRLWGCKYARDHLMRVEI